MPFPSYPGLQEQLNEPTLFWHDALLSQLWVPLVHSFTSKTFKTEKSKCKNYLLHHPDNKYFDISYYHLKKVQEKLETFHLKYIFCLYHDSILTTWFYLVELLELWYKQGLLIMTKKSERFWYECDYHSWKMLFFKKVEFLNHHNCANNRVRQWWKATFIK